jgi:UDP-glucuronate 4-epimerase
MEKKRKILVTGGAGFIGAALVKALLAAGHEVVVVDNLNPYYDPSLKRARLREFRKNIEFHRIDISNEHALDRIFARYRFDAVCHLAAQAGVRYSLTHPLTYGKSNYQGTLAVLECARRHHVPQVVFASSSSVYGEAGKVPFEEGDPCDKPVSIYAASKRAGELICQTYANLFGMDVTALRFFTVYGPWGRPDLAFFSFTKNILEGKPIELYNNGEMRRDFTYIDDIIAGFMLALEKRVPGYEVFNIGRGAPEELKSFLATLENAIGMKASVVMKPMQPGDVTETYASIEKAKGALGFDPTTTIKEGIPRFVAWYRDYFHKK